MKKPRKGRTPKCPTGVTAVWRPTAGWRFRAFPRVNGKHVPGPWRETRDEAAADVVEIRKRTGQLEQVEELLIFDHAMELMLDETKAVGRRTATLRQYQERLRPLWKHFRGMPLHDITRQLIEDYRDKRIKTPIRVKSCRCKVRATCEHKGRIVLPGPETVNKELKTLHRVFQVAIDKDRLPGQNPVSKVTHLQSEKKEALHYRASDVVEILTAIRACAVRSRTARHFHDVILVLFVSGLRLGELAHLKVEHVDLRRGVLNVPTEGKTGHRAIPMPQNGPLMTVLRRMVQGSQPKQYVLGRPPERTIPDLKTNVFKRWRPKMPEHLRRGFHCHSFRHSFATHLGASEIPEHRIRALTGHTARGVWGRYMHPSEIELRRDLDVAFGHLTADLLGDWSPHAVAAE